MFFPFLSCPGGPLLLLVQVLRDRSLGEKDGLLEFLKVPFLPGVSSVKWKARARVVALLAGALLMLWWLGHRMVFYPQRQWDADIVSLGAPAEEFFFQSPDGLTLSGVWFPARDPLGVMVYCHGNAGNISHRLPVVETWRDRLRYHVLLFDYRGYGKSEGRPSEEGIYLDTLAAFRDGRRRTAWTPVLAARSLGTVPAIRVAAEERARGLVLDSPLASASLMARKLFKVPGLHRIAGFKLDNLTAIRLVRCPILVLHGDRDEIIPLEQGRAVYEAAAGHKQFVVLEGQHHNDSREQPETIRQLAAFLAGLDG